jgi:hypothetical protein
MPSQRLQSERGATKVVGQLDIDKKGVTDKSFKMLGVTSMLEKGAV